MILKEDLEFISSFGIDKFQQKIKLHIERKNYLIKSASTLEELVKTFELRYAVYGKHYQTAPERPLDCDKYDANADHIIILDQETDEVMGTYRVLSSDFTDAFFTEGEFQLTDFKKTHSNIIEMGRATVSENARTGVVMNLLWRGLGEYIKLAQAQYLIGCATLWTQDIGDAEKAWAYFKREDVLLGEQVDPVEAGVISDWPQRVQESHFEEEELNLFARDLPPLIRSYIKAGARFGAEPSYDHNLDCIDFFTCCKVTDLSGSITKKYL